MEDMQMNYEAQTHVKPHQANMRKLGEPPYEIEMPDTWVFPSEITELVDAITWRGQRFVRERTCHNEYGLENGVPLKFMCSECGDVWQKPAVDEFKFCPNCGAKVVDYED